MLSRSQDLENGRVFQVQFIKENIVNGGWNAYHSFYAKWKFQKLLQVTYGDNSK